MLEAAIIGSGRSTPGLFSIRRRILRWHRFNRRWTLAFTRKPPGGELARVVKYLDCSLKPGGFRAFRPQRVWGYAWLRTSQARTQARKEAKEKTQRVEETLGLATTYALEIRQQAEA